MNKGLKWTIGIVAVLGLATTAIYIRDKKVNKNIKEKKAKAGAKAWLFKKA